MKSTHWLVEIRLKDWEPPLRGGTRTVAFEEVDAWDEVGARHAGFDQFEARCNFEPAMRRKMEAWGITQHNCCAQEAVQVWGITIEVRGCATAEQTNGEPKNG